MLWGCDRAVRAQQKAAALGVSLDKVSADDVELGLFSFWKPSSKLDVAGAPITSRPGKSKPAVMLSDADAQKLRWVSCQPCTALLLGP